MKNKADENFKKFHGREPDKHATLEFTMPKTLTYLGECLAVEYNSTKKLRGVSKMRGYRHKMGRNVKIYLHPNRKFIIIGGGNFRVTDWMRG